MYELLNYNDILVPVLMQPTILWGSKQTHKTGRCHLSEYVTREMQTWRGYGAEERHWLQSENLEVICQMSWCLNLVLKEKRLSRQWKKRKKILCRDRSTSMQEHTERTPCASVHSEYGGPTNHLSIWEHTAQEQGIAGNEIRWTFYALAKKLELFLQIIESFGRV